jgi:predicted phage terminase large subunit-like protein
LRVGNDKAWAQEFLLRIVSDNERVVHPEWIQYGECPAPTLANKYRGTFISIDPATSEEKKAACTAMIVVRVFGWGKDLRIYVLPYPINEHIAWPVSIERAKALSDSYGINGIRAKIYVEEFGMQKGMVQAFQAEGYPVEGLRPLGDKRTRVALISHHIKNGTIQFAPRGNEELVMQLVNFGSENYMDLADALSMVVPELINSQQGYQPFPDQKSHRVEKGEEDECDFDPITGRYIDRSRPITAGLRKMKF